MNEWLVHWNRQCSWHSENTGDAQESDLTLQEATIHISECDNTKYDYYQADTHSLNKQKTSFFSGTCGRNSINFADSLRKTQIPCTSLFYNSHDYDTKKKIKKKFRVGPPVVTSIGANIYHTCWLPCFLHRILTVH